jgi:hypothetical protein
MLRHVAFVRADVSEERIASITRVKTISELGMLAVPSNWSILMFLCSVVQLLGTDNVSSLLFLFTVMMDVICSSETLFLTTATWHHIPEDSILHSHRYENLKSYIALTSWAL